MLSSGPYCLINASSMVMKTTKFGFTFIGYSPIGGTIARFVAICAMYISLTITSRLEKRHCLLYL
jgi:hypothetical protein